MCSPSKVYVATTPGRKRWTVPKALWIGGLAVLVLSCGKLRRRKEWKMPISSTLNCVLACSNLRWRSNSVHCSCLCTVLLSVTLGSRFPGGCLRWRSPHEFWKRRLHEQRKDELTKLQVEEATYSLPLPVDAAGHKRNSFVVPVYHSLMRCRYWSNLNRLHILSRPQIHHSQSHPVLRSLSLLVYRRIHRCYTTISFFYNFVFFFKLFVFHASCSTRERHRERQTGRERHTHTHREAVWTKGSKK